MSAIISAKAKIIMAKAASMSINNEYNENQAESIE
jgi:hypothetical protein